MARPLMTNAADPRQARHADRVQTRRDRRFSSGLRVLLAMPIGRYVIAELLARLGVYTTSFDHSGSEMYFKEGRRSVALDLRKWCEHADDALTEEMEREHRARQRADDRETEAVQTTAAEATTR